MPVKIIDLSMEVYRGMPVYPNIVPPFIGEYFSHEEYAKVTGTYNLGITSTNAGIIVMGDHVGTHMDAWSHFKEGAPGAEQIPLEYCFQDGVVLNFSTKKAGEEITAEDVHKELERIGYKIKPLDIVLFRTDASKKCHNASYLTEQPGVSRDATLWLIEQGVKVMGVDAVGFDIPVPKMWETKKFWESHRVGKEHEYYHMENLVNLDQIPQPFGFKVICLPLKLRGASGSPVRAVAIVEEN